MDVTAFLESLRSSPTYQNQIVHIQKFDAREAQYAELSPQPSARIQTALKWAGIERLYTHQVEAIEHLRAGRHVVVETGTASGKTLCYNVPFLETVLKNPSSCALYLFPTKALAQDQVAAITKLAHGHPLLRSAVRVHTYDGDTPQSLRRQIRETVNVLITNPDMLHLGILPHHSRWSRFFANLRFIVLDEMHIYRGIFGSHVSNLMRRLIRICRYYGAEPQFVCCSATIDNPLGLAHSLIHQEAELVQNDGSPRGERYFVLWNPPPIDRESHFRRSANVEAQTLMADLIRAGFQTITFTRARVTTELVYRYVRDLLQDVEPALADKVRAYRGGYLPEARREIESMLASGKLRGIAATNALELGIDVGGLDACVLVGFPGTIASFWQQAGRAGRRSEAAIVVFIAHDDPVEQYLMRHPAYIFSRTPESAVVSPNNLYILADHLRCALHELPMTRNTAKALGEHGSTILDALCERGEIARNGERYYWAKDTYPAATVSLRTIGNDAYAIRNSSDGKLLGSVNAVSGLTLIHPDAIYLHDGETYLVKQLDQGRKVAYVEPAAVDYYTQPRITEDIFITKKAAEKSWCDASVQIGEVLVIRRLVAFARVRFYTQENLGVERIDMPEQELETIAFWLTPPVTVSEAIGAHPDLSYYGGLEGIKNVLASILPLRAMTDGQSIRGRVQPTPVEEQAIFLYDDHPGGLGYAHTGYEAIDQLMLETFRLISECDCEDGCPACIRPTYTLLTGGTTPDKKAALAILEEMLF